MFFATVSAISASGSSITRCHRVESSSKDFLSCEPGARNLAVFTVRLTVEGAMRQFCSSGILLATFVTCYSGLQLISTHIRSTNVISRRHIL